MDAEPDSPRRTGQELYQQHLMDTQYEREDVQKKTFGKWINSQLLKANVPLVTDLFYDLRDGTRLLALLSLLTGRSYKPERGCMRVHHLNNVSTAFRILDKHNVKLVNISSNDIVDGNAKLTLGLVWSIILHWQVQDVLKGNMAELQQSALDKTLLSWCQEATKGYQDVSITNFTTSWSDGLAFTALIHRFRPDLYDYEIVSRKPANARLDYAFRAANKHLGIARLLDPEDVNNTTPDKKSIMMYVMCLYQALPHAKIPLVTESESRSNPAGPARRSSGSNDPVDFSAYQTLMEEVLVWLLSAEDQLDSAREIASDLPSLKEQFHKHEEFLLELTSQQGSVAAVLHEGARIVKEGQLSNEEADEIHIQMRLLNSRWDQLRTKSMDRQARIHETLTKLQQQQLESLRNWLTETEDRISQLGAVVQPENLAAALKMLEDHRCLQRDLEAQQEYVNALSNMVVIVDESAGDNCSQMEDQLSALGERWSHVCQWAEQRAVALQQLADHWEHLDTNLKRLKSWLASHEHALKLIEANPSADRSQMIDVARQLQLLERDMEPHIERLNQLQDGTQRLPSLIQAVMVKEKTKRPAQPGTYRCVERLFSDIEHVEDRIEALNEIMEAQRQRLSKSGVDLKMIILPPDITTTLSMFGSDDAISSPPRAQEDCTIIKKRKLDPNRQSEFDDAIQAAKQYLEHMEVYFDIESDIDALEKRHREQKPILDQVLNTGHALVDEMEEGAEEICDVEESMRSVTERWLLIEEMIKQRSAQQQEVDRVTKVKDHDNEMQSILNMKIDLSNQEQKNEHTLNFLKTALKTANENIAELTPIDDGEWEELFIALDSFKAKVNILEAKISEYEKDLTMYTQLKNECQSLDKWMEEVQNFLTAEDVSWGDADVLEAQLEQSNALQDDVKTLEPILRNVKRVISLLSPKADEQLSQELNSISDRLSTTWVTVVADSTQKNGVLKNALDLTKRTLEGITTTNQWLDEFQADIPEPAVINSTSELSQTLRKLNALKNRVDSKAIEYKSIVDAGNVVVSHSNVNAEMKNTFDSLTQRWVKLAGGVLERQKALKAASHHYGEFKVLTAQECDWQDKLEKKLTRSTTLAADAEEISEELDDLENYMKNRPKARLPRIESMGNELVSLDIMAEEVGSEVRQLTERWSCLEEKTKAKSEWLENRVRGAQQCEQRLIQLHNAIMSIDAELNASLEQDLYGDELPELSHRLGQDITQQETLLSEIRHEEEDYEAEGRTEAANRLHEQLSLIEAALQEVKNKYRKFQNPSELEPRLERMLRVLRDLEQSMCYIELASDDCEAIEGQLNNCIRFYTSLSEIKAEVEAVLREGRQQVEDGLVDDQATVSAELDSMKALYNRLGEQVAVARETLERALQLSYELNLELNNMNDWLNLLVTEIQKTEGTFSDSENTEEEIGFYQKCLNEMTDYQPKMDGIRGNYEAFCGLCDVTLLETLRERVEEIVEEWQSIETRLRNKIASPKDESAGEEGDVDDEEPSEPRSDKGGDGSEQGIGELGGKQHGSGEIPVRMYRSVVLTSVRQFTDPESQMSEQVSEQPPFAAEEDDLEGMDDVEMEDGDAPKLDGAEERYDQADVEQSNGTTQLRPFETFGYFNAAFEDFDEQEKEAEQVTARVRSVRGMEVVRGELDQFNEEDEEEMETSSSSSQSITSDSTSSEASESGSVKYMALDDNASSSIPALDEPYTVEVCSSQLPSPEKPSMEVLDSSRPMTPEEFPLELEHKDAAPFASPEDSEVEDTPRSLAEPVDADERRLAMEHVVMERLRVEEAPMASQERTGSPVHATTPPSTPAARDEVASFQHFEPPLSAIVDEMIDGDAAQNEMDDIVLDEGEKLDETNQTVETPELLNETQSDSTARPTTSDDQAFQSETELERSDANQTSIPVGDQSSPPPLPEPSSSQQETDAETGSNQLLASETTDVESTEEASVNNEVVDVVTKEEMPVIVSVRSSRKVSRDEGTQTEFCALTGRLHATKAARQADELVSIIEPQYSVALQVDPATQSPDEAQVEAEEVLSPEPLEQPEFDQSEEASEQVAAKSDEAMDVAEETQVTSEAKPVLAQQVSDGEVFVDQPQPVAEANEEDDSFYGSDKDVDGDVEFSQTESARSSTSSSSDSDVVPGKQAQEDLLQDQISLSNAADEPCPFDSQIAGFEKDVTQMLARIDDVTAKFSASTTEDIDGAELELAALEPDVASLISRGDSLVLQVQKVDLERALRTNATTGQLRSARSALKTSSEVRRQRLAEQEVTLKECQQQTEQLQIWLANIAQTLDHVTRARDPSQLQSLEAELNKRQSDIRQLTEATGKLQEQQLLEYQALIGSLTLRWHELQRQFLEYQTREATVAPVGSSAATELPSDNIMGGPDFVTRVNKLREAIASVSRQMHSPPLNLKHYEQMSGQEDSIKAVKNALYTLKCDVDTYNRGKDEAVDLAETTEQKEQIQRVLGKMHEEWTLLNKTYSDKQARVNQSLATWRTLHSDMKDFEEWIGQAETALAVLQAEGLNRAERKEKLKELESQVTARHKVMSNITSTCREVGAECSTADAILLREKQDTLGKRWRALLAGLAAVRQRLTSLDGSSPVPVSKLSPLVMSTPPRKADETQGSESDLAGGTRETPPTTPSTIVASLDKSILQIRDWLTVLETMLKQQVAIVGDADDVLQLLEKQKNVLRELEQKKPQLDELVQTAESIKDSGSAAVPSSTPPVAGKSAQVSKLREHWEETAVAVTSRRNQLEELLGDSHQFERRRQDIDQWLGRMENRLSKLAPIAATADMIDSQHREQKVLHGEIQQYKVQVDQLTQLTERLVSSYPHDDTRRAVRTNDNIVQRYSALDAGVNARGRALSAAMGSLHSFDRALDKFMAWLSDAESSLESLELELESYGPGVKTSRERVLMQLKELSVELDDRRDEQAGLAASGQRLINSLTDGHLSSAAAGNGGNGGGDDALMLRRRLDDMNRRWHGLRAKTVAIRNRLENNTEHWNALLLSLRELIEWVIRKDTELTGLGPIRGDLSALIKQQDDFRAFRRQLDDKRPLIEQSILTGRQLVANEAPLSDASDSEANREFVPGDSRGYRSAEEAARELTHGIRREGTKLAERWAALRDRTDRWSVDLDATTSRMQQLQASMEDASNRLAPAETARAKWISPADLSQQQVQQQMDQLKELSDKIAPLQLAIEEVNDQAARLADSGVPLSHANLAKLDDLNSRWKVLQASMDDRYQQLCGVTRDGALNGTLLQSFLASSVERPWERSITEADVPYYVNHQSETTQWDHPQFEELMNSLSEYNDVRFSAYRMALKLRRVQKFLCLDKLELSTAIDTFDAHGLRAQNDKVIDIPDMVTVLRSLYEVVLASYPNEVRLPLIIDLCLNWILNVYDSQRSGEIRVLSFKVIISLMCRGHLEEKYRYLFRLIADPNRLVDAPKLGVLLHDCVQLPRELGEVAAFGGSNIEPSVNSCFEKAGKQRQSIEAVHFLAWMKREPQSVVWLPVLHRLAASENARHQAKCNVCKTSPIMGLRYRCLKCLSFDMCQNCFFTGKVAKHHKLTHPMQEYCTTTTSGEDLKDFTRTLRNKFKSKRYFKKHPRLGYLPVQTALEGTATPSDMQSENSSQMPPSTSIGQEIIVHSTSVSVNDGIHKDFTPESEDEHQLIAQYCRSLNGEPGSNSGTVPRSPVQLLASLDSNHKEEIETMIRELEEENATLQAEYERLRSQQSPSMSFSFSSSPDDATPIPHHHLANTSGTLGASLGTPTMGTLTSDVERDMLAEARLLRQHKTRLEARMKILEEHNRQLETQLSRLRQLLDEPSGNTLSPARTGTLQTRAVTAAHLATDTPVRTNGIGHDSGHSWTEHNAVDRLETRPPPPPHGSSSSYAQSSAPNTQNVGNLLFMAGDLGRAVGSLVNVMTDADDHSPTDEEN